MCVRFNERTVCSSVYVYVFYILSEESEKSVKKNGMCLAYVGVGGVGAVLGGFLWDLLVPHRPRMCVCVSI